MILNKEGIPEEDVKLALKLLGRLRRGDRVFGNPGEGLKKTLKQLEQSSKQKYKSPTEFSLNYKSDYEQIQALKAGVMGEELLAGHIEKLLKYNKELDGVVVFASLSYEGAGSAEDYVSDTDFVAIYGKNALILDAKYIKTSPEVPVFLEGNVLKSMTKPLVEVRSSIPVWRSFFHAKGIEIDSISSYVVIVNKQGAVVWKNKDWYESPCPPIFIADLEKYLTDWVRGLGPQEVSLKLLTEISKTQIRKEKSGIKFGKAIDKFKI